MSDFRVETIKCIGDSSVRLFVGNADAYALVSDLGDALGIKGPSVRSELSRNGLGSLVPVPELRQWLIDQRLLPTNTGNIQFAESKTWLKLMRRHLTNDQYQCVCNSVRILLPIDDKTPEKEEEKNLEVDRSDQCGVSEDSSSVDSSDSSCDSSDSSSSSSAELKHILPAGVPESVLADIVLPDSTEFSRDQYTKSYALKNYDIPKPLRRELRKLRKWWTKKVNLERKEKAIGDTTVGKREEHLLCFLGFCKRYRCASKLSVALVLSHKLFDSFIEYLLNVRESSPGTIAEMITCAISACKWLYRKENRQIGERPLIVRRYMDLRNQYQSQALRVRANTDIQTLEKQHRWIEWPQFTACVARLRDEWEQSDKTISFDSAWRLMLLLLLGLYSCIPARGKEVRLLQYIPKRKLSDQRQQHSLKRFVEKKQINLVTEGEEDQEWMLFISQYKNYRWRGVESCELSAFGWWTDLLQLYLSEYREELVASADHHYVFVARNGLPFTDNRFSEFIASQLQRLTGNRVSTNLLRSSFVSHFYSSEASKDPTMRESIANVMMHSEREARRTYDRRTTTQRKRPALQLLAREAVASKKQAIDDCHHLVVEWHHHPHQVIKQESGKMLLGKMERDSTTNAPVYRLPVNAHFEWKPLQECIQLQGEWDDDDRFCVQ